MKNKIRLRKLLIGLIVIVVHYYFIGGYMPLFQWGQVKVSALVCTCPNESVQGGRLYLRWITPDSLKQYDLDYSEIYVTETPTSAPDLMGTDNYIIKGEIIGKKRVSKNDPWNPLVKVNSWTHNNLLLDLLVIIIVSIELFIFFLWFFKS